MEEKKERIAWRDISDTDFSTPKYSKLINEL